MTRCKSPLECKTIKQWRKLVVARELKTFRFWPVFVNLLRGLGIGSQPSGPVQQPFLSYRPARLHRLTESIPGLHKSLEMRTLTWKISCSSFHSPVAGVGVLVFMTQRWSRMKGCWRGSGVKDFVLWQRSLILNKADGFTSFNICCTFPTPFLYVSL